MDHNGASNTSEDTTVNVCKARRKRQRRLVGKVCYEYAQSTSLQGIPFITRRELTIVEKAFWLITFIASLVMCGYLIRDVWIKWQTSPVIVTVSEQLVPVIKVPLPSITICPQAKCNALVYNYSSEMNEVYQNHYSLNASSQERFDKFERVSVMCGDHKNSYWAKLSFLKFRSRYHDANIFKDFNEVALDYEDIFKACEISNHTISCRKLFSKVLTASGICYTMNSLAAEEIFRMDVLQKNFPYLNTTKPSKGWSMDHGYENDSMSSDFYPDRGLYLGGAPNVDILFGQQLGNHDKFCFGYATGLNLHIQHPADMPDTSLSTYTLMNDQIATLALSFNIMNTSETLRSSSYDPEIRQCYFPEDRQLKYFKIYTAANCRLECLSNFTFQQCRCVRFFMPHNASDRICTFRHRYCIKMAQVKLAYRESGNDIERCQCLPSCNSIEYDGDLLRNDHKFEEAMKITRNRFYYTKNFSKTKFTRLIIFYKKPRFVSMRRSELFGMTDFLANCGGLLGLFLGFSFLSLVEIFYFSTLRMCCVLRKDMKTEKLEPKEKQRPHEKF